MDLKIGLRREGWKLGRDQAYRLYYEEALQLRSKLPKRRKMLVRRREKYAPRRTNQAWTMDFVSDQLTNGQRFRALTILDAFSRKALAIQVGKQLRGENVVEVCNALVAQRGAPKRVFTDNNFISRTAQIAGPLAKAFAASRTPILGSRS